MPAIRAYDRLAEALGVSFPADADADRAATTRAVLAWLALSGQFLGAMRILPHRDGTFDFARGEGGRGAMVLFVADREGELITGSIVDEWVNQVARKVQADPGGGSLFLGEAAWLLEMPVHGFVDCIAWLPDEPARVLRRNALVDAIWQPEAGLPRMRGDRSYDELTESVLTKAPPHTRGRSCSPRWMPLPKRTVFVMTLCPRRRRSTRSEGFTAPSDRENPSL